MHPTGYIQCLMPSLKPHSFSKSHTHISMCFIDHILQNLSYLCWKFNNSNSNVLSVQNINLLFLLHFQGITDYNVFKRCLWYRCLCYCSIYFLQFWLFLLINVIVFFRHSTDMFSPFFSSLHFHEFLHEFLILHEFLCVCYLVRGQVSLP